MRSNQHDIVTLLIITASIIGILILFIPSFLGYNLLAENGESVNSLNLSESMRSQLFRDSLLCSASFLLAPIIGILSYIVPDEREKIIPDLLRRLIILFASFCPNLIIVATMGTVSYASVYPAIYASQQIVILAVFCLVYMQHGSSVWRQETVCGAFAMGMITLLCKCYSAYYFTNVLSVLAVILLGITYLAYTIQFMLFISYIYSNYTKYSKKLSHSDYICCVHMFGQELYSLFFFVSSLTKDGLRWQDASAFHLYSHVYVLVFLNGFVSIFYDRLAQRDLSWTQASIFYISKKSE